ncbi:MAG TPA: hypothetical protein VJM48_02675 [Methylibium sp.]|nr:hypothetical protein [Methylibium sp.]
MLETLSPLWKPAVAARLLLLANHVLLAEPAAVERLRAHRGRSLRLDWGVEAGPWPSPPPLHLRVSPAGLLEPADDASPAAELRVRVALPPPVQFVAGWLAGERPAVTVEGDAQFAADVAWLGEHLRWDVAHDLDRLLGPAAAHGLVRLLGGTRTALAELVRGARRPTASR